MRAVREKARGYADFFEWTTNRDLEEWGVLTSLFQFRDSALPYTKVRMRGRGNDPPDCEALNEAGRRVAIEVTEFVDGKAIRRFKAGAVYGRERWDREKFPNAAFGPAIEKR